jgi:hypothetical protein
MTMICRVCHESKQEEEFAKKTTRKDGSIVRNTVCKPCQRTVSQKHYNENKKDYLAKNERKKQELLKFMRDHKENSQCERCGMSGKGNPEIMDFKYKENEIRKDRISYLISYSKKIIMEEIAKCNLYCANCQRIVDSELKIKRITNKNQASPMP